MPYSPENHNPDNKKPDNKSPQVPVPPQLKNMQENFAASIRTPLRIDDDGYQYNTDKYAAQSVASMIDHPAVIGIDRLSTYNQQYWFRLLTCMQDECPLLRHLLTVSEMNRLSTAYLTTYPSMNPSLNYLIHRLPQFLETESLWSVPHIQQCAQLEYIHNRVFDAASYQSITHSEKFQENPEFFLNTPITFPKSWFLFEENWDLVAQRHNCSNDPDDRKKIKLTEQHSYWAIFRSSHTNGESIHEEPLSPLQWQLLQKLQTGQTINNSLAEMEHTLDSNELEVLENELGHWFAQWTRFAWFC